MFPIKGMRSGAAACKWCQYQIILFPSTLNRPVRFPRKLTLRARNVRTGKVYLWLPIVHYTVQLAIILSYGTPCIYSSLHYSPFWTPLGYVQIGVYIFLNIYLCSCNIYRWVLSSIERCPKFRVPFVRDLLYCCCACMAFFHFHTNYAFGLMAYACCVRFWECHDIVQVLMMRYRLCPSSWEPGLYIPCIHYYNWQETPGIYISEWTGQQCPDQCCSICGKVHVWNDNVYWMWSLILGMYIDICINSTRALHVLHCSS